MKLVTMRIGNGSAAARIDGDRVVELSDGDVGTLLNRENWRDVAEREGYRDHALNEVELLAPVPVPTKVICVGLNYRSHVEEMGRPIPDHPTLFAKFADALVGPRDAIVLPQDAAQADWEGELALVIGKPVRRADSREARAAIAGFMVMNDITMRDWQHRTTQWLQGKTFENTTPIGPALVTPDEVDWAENLTLDCLVDGNLMQSGRTSDLIFTPVQIIQYISQITTLRPGDVIATGTPSGVAAGRAQEVPYLQPGQLVETRIGGLGELVNRCVREPAAPVLRASE